MPITALSTPPSRNDPANFASRADMFLAELPTFAAEANILQADVNAKQTAAAANQVAAQAAQAAAEAASSATVWVSGTTYAAGDVRYSPSNFKSYRRKTAGAGTTDPSADSTNWQLLTSLGDVDTSSTQTLTNKTHSTGSTWNGNAIPVANGGTGATTAANAFTALKQNATETATGVVELADSSEVINGTDTTRAITPSSLRMGFQASGGSQSIAGVVGAQIINIPSWVSTVKLNLVNVSTNGTADIIVRELRNSSVISSGYVSAGANIVGTAVSSKQSTIGHIIGGTVTAANVINGTLVFNRISNGASWHCYGVFSTTESSSVRFTQGRLTNAGNLTGILITTANGTDVFDTGGQIFLEYF